MHSSLRQLAELILKNVDILDADLQKRNVKAPSLDELWNPAADIAFHDPEIMKASDVICSAARQLVQTVRPPPLCVMHNVIGVRALPPD